MKSLIYLTLFSLVLSGTTLAQGHSRHSRPDRQYREELETLSRQLVDATERLRRSFDDGYGEMYGYDSQYAPAVYQLKNLIQAAEHLLNDVQDRQKFSHLEETFSTLFDCFYPAELEVGKLRLTSPQNQNYENMRTIFHKIAARFRNLPEHLEKTYTLADSIGNAVSRNYELNTLYYEYQNFLKNLRQLQEVSMTHWSSPFRLNKEYDDICTIWNRLYSTLISHSRSGGGHRHHQHGYQSLNDAMILQLDRYIRDTKIYLTLTYIQETHVHNCQCDHLEYTHIHVDGCLHNHQHSCRCGCPEYLNYHFENCGHLNYVHTHHCRCGHRRYANQHYKNCGHEIHVHNCRCGHAEYRDSHYANCGHTVHEHHCRCGCPQYKDAHYGNCGHTVHQHHCRCGCPEYKDAHYGNCGHTVHVHHCRCGHPEYKNQHYGNCGHSAW